jgi:antitoxin MazE
MQVAIRKMGNSHGVLIPKPVLAELGLTDVADLVLNKGVIEIRAIKTNPRAGWSDYAKRLAASGEDALVWPEFANEADAELNW